MSENNPWAVISVGNAPIASVVPTPTPTQSSQQGETPASDNPWEVTAINGQAVSKPSTSPAPHVPAAQTSQGGTTNGQPNNDAVAQHGLLRRAWDFVNSPIADLSIAGHRILPEGVKTSDIIKAAAFEKMYGEAYIPGFNDFDTKAEEHFGSAPAKMTTKDGHPYVVTPESHAFKNAVKTFIAGSAKDASDMAASFTSPVGIATTLAGVGPEAKAGSALAKAAPVAKALVGTAFGAKGLSDIIHAGTENTPEAWQQRLQGAAMVTGGATAAHEPLSELGDTLTTARAAKPTADVSTETPVERVAAKNAAKASITKGNAAITEAPKLSDIQSDVQQAVRDSINEAAKAEGLQEVPAETSIRDIGKGLGDQFYARSKATFAKVQEVTGVDLNSLSDKISTLDDKIADAIDNPEKAGQLEQQKLGLENQADDAFSKAKSAGVDAEQARTDWKKYNASYDFGKQVRAATDGRAGVGSGEILDPNKLAPRLQKLSDSNSPTQPGRLQQFMGDDTTTNLLDKMEQSRGAIRDFEPSTATGQQALKEIIQKNTGTGVTGRMTGIPQFRQLLGFKPTTNWLGVYRDMSGLSADELNSRFGADAPKARAYVTSQARWQLGKMLVAGYAIKKIADETGIPAPVLHVITGGAE